MVRTFLFLLFISFFFAHLWLPLVVSSPSLPPFSTSVHDRPALIEKDNPKHWSRHWTSDPGKFLTRGRKQVLEGSEGSVGFIKDDVLGFEVRRKDLNAVHLDYFRFNNDPEHMITPKCKGGSCQEAVFEKCEGNFSALSIESCWNAKMSDLDFVDPKPPLNCPLLEPRPGPGIIPVFNSNCSSLQDYIRHEMIGGQIYILHSVFINSRGNPFTSKYHFDRGGCACDGEAYEYLSDTPVRVFDEVINLAHWNAYAFFHGIVELMPAILLLVDVLRRNPQIPVAHRQGQHSFLQNVGLHLLGIRAEQLNIFEFKDSELIFGKKVYQPYYAPCARPSRSQWQFLRSNFLLPSDGIPILNPDWTFRKPKRIASESDGFPSDWLAVLGKRYGERNLLQSDDIEMAMVKIFGKERVVTFDGSVSIIEARALFNRARIFVSPHGAAMTNMFFMPFGSIIFEIRPNAYFNACFHFLAEVSRHSYYLVLAEGTKHTSLDANTTEVLDVLNTIARSLQ